MSVNRPKPDSIPDEYISSDEWSKMEPTEQFSSELSLSITELGFKYMLHPSTAFGIAMGVACSLLSDSNKD